MPNHFQMKLSKVKCSIWYVLGEGDGITETTCQIHNFLLAFQIPFASVHIYDGIFGCLGAQLIQEFNSGTPLGSQVFTESPIVSVRFESEVPPEGWDPRGFNLRFSLAPAGELFECEILQIGHCVNIMA